MVSGLWTQGCSLVDASMTTCICCHLRGLYGLRGSQNVPTCQESFVACEATKCKCKEEIGANRSFTHHDTFHLPMRAGRPCAGVDTGFTHSMGRGTHDRVQDLKTWMLPSRPVLKGVAEGRGLPACLRGSLPFSPS